MSEIFVLVFLIMVGLLVLVYILMDNITLCQVEWKKRWKQWFKEVIIVYGGLLIVVPLLNPQAIRMIDENGWCVETFSQIILLSTIFFLMILPFLNMRHMNL